MTDELRHLIEQARAGAPEPFAQLVENLRRLGAADAALIVEFARAAEEVQRRAAIQAAQGRVEPDILAAIADLGRDPVAGVRQCLAYALQDYPAWPLDAVAERLLQDADSNVRQAAVWAIPKRPNLVPALLRRFTAEDNPYVRENMASALSSCPPRQVLPDALTYLAQDTDSVVQQNCAHAAEKHLATLGGYPTDLPRPAAGDLFEMRRRIDSFSDASFPKLSKFLDKQLAQQVDLEQLKSYGKVLTHEADRLPRAFGVDDAIQRILSILQGPPPRAAVLIGESGAGKTAIVYELVHRLKNHPAGPWHVLRLSPQDFLTDTRYLGDWETRVRNIVKAIASPKRVILYVPQVDELAWVGVSEKSNATVVSALAPHIESGELVLLGESSAEALRRAVSANRVLRRLVPLEVQPADTPTTRHIMQQVADEAGAEVPEGVLERIGELAEFFVAGAVEPGRSVGLLRRVLDKTAGRPITDHDVLHVVSSTTGIPSSLLDDSVALDRAQVRSFFEARVMGQPEAIDAVVDLVTLVKAGLNDPSKPLGVFLFVGPTGVGKTELARATAEHLFGDPARLIRLDMSEFATYEAFERLIGQGYRAAEPGLLTAAVRDHPFSVLLLDEIEKAHPNIYNLCLQIFDAGRLTDTHGRTADFRRTIIILTSNIGTGASDRIGGFGASEQRAPDRELILREVSRWFRPEFLNRLDRIVTFRPLEKETAEKIARREVARVLERSGIARRRLAVDVDPHVFPLLLKEGYSHTFGARPLKRTVERLVLLPVARAIADGKAPAGSILRLGVHDKRLYVAVEPPEPSETLPAAPPPARPLPGAERAAGLLQRVQALQEQSAPLAARKSHLLAQSSQPGFWNDAGASRRMLDEVYRLDGILAALAELEKQARAHAERLARRKSGDRLPAAVEERLSALESQVQHVGFLVSCSESRQLGDAYVTLKLVSAQGGGLDGVATLARMYQALARRRGLEIEVLDDRQGGEPAEDTITLVVSGAGAYALLAGEAGLHQVTRGRREARNGKKERNGKKAGPQRDIVRVEVLPTPVGEVEFAPDDIRVEAKALPGSRGRLLARLKFEVHLFHGPSLTSVRAWCDGAKQEAIARLRPLLWARIDAARVATPADTNPPVVRRYRLGPTTLVRDQRTGLHTARLDQVLQGHLDMFLTRPGA